MRPMPAARGDYGALGPGYALRDGWGPSQLGSGSASHGCCGSGKAQPAPDKWGRGSAMRRLITLLVAAMVTAVRIVLLAAAWCGAAHPELVITAGTGSDLGGGGMAVAQSPPGGIGDAVAAASPAPGSELPMLPGAGKETSSSNRALDTRLAGLAQHSDPALQFGQGLLWLNHTDQGAQGVGISVLPLSQAPQQLTIEGVYIDQEVGSVSARPAAGHNKAWSLAVNSRWLGERLTLHGEYAQSQKNRGAWDSLSDQHSGQAYTLLASYADQTQIFADQPLVWGLTVDWQQAGREFWSPTAGNVPRDRAIAQAAADIHWVGIDARLSLARTTNNVADDPGVPTLCINTLTADLHYTARQPLWSSSFGRLFAEPSYALSLKHERSGLEQAPQTGMVNIPDRYLDTASLTARFAPGPWWWEVSYTHSMLRVLGQEATSMDSNRTQLNLHLPLSDWLDLTPALQWSLIHGAGSDNEIQLITGTLGGSAALIPDRLAARLNFRAHRRYSSEEETENESVAVESSLDWTLQSSRGNRPNVTISLRGSYLYADNTANSSSVQYQAFSGIQVSWPDTN